MLTCDRAADRSRPADPSSPASGWTRREFLHASVAAAAVGSLAAAGRARPAAVPSPSPAASGAAAPLFEISLAQWSLHRALRAKEITSLDFARLARERYGIGAIEYVNSFLRDGIGTAEQVRDLNARAKDHGVRQLLIMCDGEGALGDPDEPARLKAVENHVKWLELAAALGCHSIRVNADARGKGTPDEQAERAADGLRRLCVRAEKFGLNVIVENHGGLSSNGAWLAGVMRRVQHPRCGTLPDFGNFSISATETYDRYRGVGELMPFAKAVSAKSHDFNDAGDETATDYRRMMRIVLDAGYRGFVGVEYEGSRLGEPEGIIATRKLLETVRAEIAAERAKK